ncbi:AAA family ATPase [Myxococcota bacterium]|nr:AAA family ATPase [Myxococcota bacterium]MBU1534973.1 AAA family ATPase [Myxococcota bacterium]
MKRQQSLLSDGSSTYIDTLQIKNFRCFSDLNLKLHPELTVLVSANGQGKTSILDALRIVLSPYFRPIPQGSSVGIDWYDSRRVRYEMSMEQQWPVEIAAEGYISGEYVNWQRFLRTAKSHTTVRESKDLIAMATELKKRVEANEEVVLPVFAYYGSQRLWREKRLRTKILREHVKDKSRLAGYLYAWEPNSSSEYFLEWFFYAVRKNERFRMKVWENAQLSNGNPGEKDLREAPHQYQLDQIRRGMDTALAQTGWKRMDCTSEDSLALHHDIHGELVLDQLSDGIRITALMVGDLAYRAVRLNPHLKGDVLSQTPGIVMIDEIELHLHPAWQQTIIPSLREVFPKIQFIITTHSPQILSTVPSESIRIMEDQHIYSPEIGTEGAEASRILKRVFMVDNRPPNIANAQNLARYAELVHADKWDSDEAIDLRKRLDAIFKDDEPELQRLDLYIDNRRWEQKQ